MKESFLGKRERGRPRLSWMKDAENDLLRMNVTDWRGREKTGEQ